MVWLEWAALSLAALPVMFCLANLWIYQRPAAVATDSSFEISVLIPARNEELSIESAVRSALACKQVDLEIIVLDDHSQDSTARIVRELAKSDGRLRLESAPPLPPGWCGKQFACFTLAQLASKPVLCFLDADVRLTEKGLARMAGFLRSSGAALVSGVPKQEMKTWSEQLVLPLIHLILLGYLPMWAMRRGTHPAFGAGCGQLFVTARDVYHAVGGHSAIRNSRHDGVTLPRAYRKAGYRSDLCDATDVATCRMYRNAKQLFYGLLKNATEGMASPLRLVVFTALLFGGAVVPALLLAWIWVAGGSTKDLGLIAISGGLAFGMRLFLALRFQQPVLAALAHPISVTALLCLQWYALARQFAGLPSTWKDRTYQAT